MNSQSLVPAGIGLGSMAVITAILALSSSQKRYDAECEGSEAIKNKEEFMEDDSQEISWKEDQIEK